jgi:hypothetical protein
MVPIRAGALRHYRVSMSTFPQRSLCWCFGTEMRYTQLMEKFRTSIRLSVTGKDLLSQVALALGLNLSSTLELLIREKALNLGLKAPPAPGGPSSTGG